MLSLRPFLKAASGILATRCGLHRAHDHGLCLAGAAGGIGVAAGFDGAGAPLGRAADLPAVQAMAASAPVATLDDGYTRVVTKPANKVATRTTTVGGKRVRVIDVHAHVAVADSLDIVKGTPAEKAVLNQLTSRDSIFLDDKRLEDMDANGIDVAAVSVNSYWDRLDKSMVTRLLDVQNARLAELSGAVPERFQAFASVAMQYPDVAVKQLERAIKELGLCGVAIGASIADDELSDRKFDPFWAKAEELQALVFIHPQRTAPHIRSPRLDGLGALPVVLGHPFETAIGLAHLIFEGTLDRFPDVKICAAHGGGLLPSYPSRIDHGCHVFPKQCEGLALKKKPSEYLRQLYFDTLVFTPENIRHLAAVCGAGQLVIGTDYPTPWVDEAIDPIMETPGLSDAERIAILGGTAARLLKLDS